MRRFRATAGIEVGHVYLVDDQTVLMGQVPIERLLHAKEQTALASGQIATVVQDILSVGIYLMIATALLPM